jgi:DNA primase
MPGIRFAEVRAQITMAEVLHLLGFVPSSISGGHVRGRCPVHRSRSRRSRSFSADLKRQVYHCFRCGASGNQLDLYAAAKGLTIFQATVELCEHLHREIPWVYHW